MSSKLGRRPAPRSASWGGSVERLSDAAFAYVFTSRLAPLAYLLTLPFAELYFYRITRRFMAEQKVAEHHTFSPFVDAAEAIRFWEFQMLENPARIHALLRGW